MTLERVPTCHRTSFCAIASDEDYKSALSYADVIQKEIYEEEAKVIDDIQKRILKISQNEDPYDVFICYKETDRNGERTIDSTIAYEIYQELTEQELKVFYAAVTLEEKLGQEYEPYIFAALNSAKVMLVIGTKPEYFNAVWVKNEWSRFLKLMKNDRSKTLIPCYRDMDAYEFPKEFSNLQAQDMSKIGFIIDVVRGIKKIVDWEEETATEGKKEDLSENPSIEPLLKRAFLFLEDREWNMTQQYAEMVLNMEPENAQAYLCKLMADCCVYNVESLAWCKEPFDENKNYKKILRFGDRQLVETLKDSVKKIKERKEEARLSKLYEQTVAHMKICKTAEEYEAVRWEFAQIEDYRDAKTLAEKCAQKSQKILECIKANKKNAAYDSAYEKYRVDTVESVTEAMAEFRNISGWKDADQKIIECQEKIDRLKRNKKRRKLLFRLILPACFVGYVFIVSSINRYKAGEIYKSAVQDIKNEDYEDAIDKLDTIVFYEDTKELLTDTALIYAEQCVERDDYESAIIALEKANYRGEEYLEACYVYGKEFYDKDEIGGYKLAITYFEKIVEYNYKDSVQLLEDAKTKNR